MFVQVVSRIPITFVALILLVGGSAASSARQLTDSGHVAHLVSVGEDIQAAVISRDVRFFIDNGAPSYNFEGEQFNEQVRRFLYDDEWMKQVGQDHETRSVDSILRDDDIVITPVVDGTRVTLIYHSGSAQLSTEFLESRFIIEYVSVEFEMTEQGWALINSIFFAESGGPYQVSAG